MDYKREFRLSFSLARITHTIVRSILNMCNFEGVINMIIISISVVSVVMYGLIREGMKLYNMSCESRLLDIEINEFIRSH